MVGVVAQKNTHQASTYLRDVSAETLFLRLPWGGGHDTTVIDAIGGIRRGVECARGCV